VIESQTVLSTVQPYSTYYISCINLSLNSELLTELSASSLYGF